VPGIAAEAGSGDADGTLFALCGRKVGTAAIIARLLQASPQQRGPVRRGVIRPACVSRAGIGDERALRRGARVPGGSAPVRASTRACARFVAALAAEETSALA